MSSPGSTVYDVIVIGGGHDGLVAAATLGQAGKRVVLLEKRAVLGGRTVTEELAPGFHFSPVLSHGGRLRNAIIKSLGLTACGLEYIACDPYVFAVQPDGRHLSLWRATRRTIDEIARFSKRDAAAYPKFTAFMNRLVRALDHALDLAPPDVDAPEAGELVSLARLGVNLRLLGHDDLMQFMRMGVMPLKDFLDEWFETDLLKAALGACAVQGTQAGPRAPGTASLLLLRWLLGYADVPRGGMGRVASALERAARKAEVEIRTSCEVTAIAMEGGNPVGVRLASGEVLHGSRVLSNVDPVTTYLDLIPANSLQPTVQRRAGRLRQRGRTARILLALKELPTFSALQGEHFQSTVGRESDSRERLRGRIHIGASIDVLERTSDDARMGQWSRDPVLDISIPTIMDPQRAPAGQHIMEILVQSAPYHLRDGTWAEQREAFADHVIDHLERLYVPGLKAAILHRTVLTPADLEATYGLREGHLEHGEHGLDQLFVLRPLPASYRYASPVNALYLCGAGSHPGGGTTGASGANAAREILRASHAGQGARESLFSPARSSIAAGLAILGAGLAVGATVRAFSKSTREGPLERHRSDDTTEEDLQV